MQKSQFVKSNTTFSEPSIQKTIALLEEGATIPFIARYRKEVTQGLDEVEIAKIRDFSKQFDDIIKRKITIVKSIEEQGKLTASLSEEIEKTFDLSILEDIYLPFKQKRITRGEKARKSGLEGLAKILMAQKETNIQAVAQKFVKGTVSNKEEALQGAQDIIAEWINENVQLRQRLRRLFQTSAVLSSKLIKGKAVEAQKYKDYFDYSESLSRCASHRFLALIRASNEGFLRLKAAPEKERCINSIERVFLKPTNNTCSEYVKAACLDAYKRLLLPSLETQALNEKKVKADTDAIRVFSKNLNQLLLASPLGGKRILAIDPGFRTGCKVVCLNEKGDLLFNQTIFPHPPQNESSKAKNKLAQLIETYKIEAVAVGDGTAGRETVQLFKYMKFKQDIEVYSVREDGASIYSASSIARKEFPTFDITVRGAVSIGRRLMDPLAELVKIDAKSIGVGQYQHEVDQNLLKEALDDTVVSCVNRVGVDLNTASPYLLQYVSGLSLGLAENIIEKRNELGRFSNRNELKKVKRLGEKAFEQCAGFLRITDGESVLDNTTVHPESYGIVNDIARRNKLKIEELLGNEIVLDSMKASDLGVNPVTFEDLITELKKPTRDPREKVEVFSFDENIKSIDDLKIGMVVNGLVTNVTNFGAFVNIGIKENGLIHKSQLSEDYIDDPADFISLNEQVRVTVISLDVERKRIGLKK
ncbi:MAG: Tex family protein [Lishizhenia sp.]